MTAPDPSRDGAAPDPGRVLRRALIGWGLGHLLVGYGRTGWALLAAEVVSALLIAWLTISLADTSAYLVPFLAGVAFLAAWAGQAVAAYHIARRLQPEPVEAPPRSPALAMGWLSLPLLVWGTGFWLIGAGSATPAAVLDRFVTSWTDDTLGAPWSPSVVRAAREARADLGDRDSFRDVRIRIVSSNDSRASALAEAIHFERRASRFLGVFAGSELVPVADRPILQLQLAARPVELVGGGDSGAVRWELVEAHVP